MRIDDLVVFGRTAPEDSVKHGQSVCMAGYSPEMRQFIRVYPMAVRSNVKARSVITVEVERNNKDSRMESWTLKDRSERSITNIKPQIHKTALQPILNNSVTTIEELNNNKLSIGVIKPEHYDIELKTRDKIAIPGQLSLFDSFQKQVSVRAANSYYHAPYLKLYNASGQNCLQIREWGVYELMRSYEMQYKTITASDIKKALYINDSKDVYFVIGNMVASRNVWMVIKVFTYDKQEQLSLFTEVV